MTRRSGIATRTVFDAELLRSADVQRLQGLMARIRESAPGPYAITSGAEGEEHEAIDSATALLSRVLERGQKGLSFQRYKGLGEMNADQLADTTMNPDARTFLQVRIPDVVEADDAFTKLMGDDVEPRREFIERNALDVQNLDV